MLNSKKRNLKTIYGIYFQNFCGTLTAVEVTDQFETFVASHLIKRFTKPNNLKKKKKKIGPKKTLALCR